MLAPNDAPERQAPGGALPHRAHHLGRSATATVFLSTTPVPTERKEPSICSPLGSPGGDLDVQFGALRESNGFVVRRCVRCAACPPATGWYARFAGDRRRLVLRHPGVAGGEVIRADQCRRW